MERTRLTELPPVPEFGFYYSYKHDPNGAVNNYAYYIFNIGHHTEDDCRPVDLLSVDFLPLYPSYVYELGKGRLSDSRPLESFMSKAMKDGVEVERYVQITDPDVIDALCRIKKEMYPNRNS